MTRCIDFYRKWIECGGEEWCARTPGAVSQINSYLKIVDALAEQGVPQSFTFVNLPEGAARPICGIKNPEVKDKVIGRVLGSLKAKKKYRETMQKGDIDPGKISYNDVKDIINQVVEPEKQHPPTVEEESYFLRLRVKDTHGEDTSAWIKIPYSDYEELIIKYGAV
jgi:hypothetical protein